jgi:Domain of unknown function (DUF4349)
MRNASTGAVRTFFALVVVLVLIAVVAACGAGSGAAAPAGGQAAGPAASHAASRDVSEQGQPVAPDDASAAFRDGSKIIRTGSIQLEVADVTAAVGAARSAIQGMGGYIGASQQYSDGENVVATISYRVPADRWEDALDSLRALGTEVGEQTDTADVTGQIVDLDARIRNLRASETALVKHLADAARVADVLEIESRLSDVRGQIEQLSAQKANLDDQVAFATLTVTFGVEVQAINEAAARWDPGTEVEQAGASLVGFLQVLASAAIWLAIVGLPIILMVTLIVAIGLFVARRLGLLRRASPPPPPAAAEG